MARGLIVKLREFHCPVAIPLIMQILAYGGSIVFSSFLKGLDVGSIRPFGVSVRCCNQLQD
jgi:hypothetical protein